MVDSKHTLQTNSSATRLLTAQEMQEVDQRAIASGLNSFGLMQNAGDAVTAAIIEHWTPRPTTVVCGSGNNGGDGFVVASNLQAAGWTVTVVLLGSENNLTGDAAQAASLWGGPIESCSPGCLENAELVVDALFGAGLSRALQGEASDLIHALKNSAIPVCAIDVPSGVHGTTGEVLGCAAHADLTVTFFRKKPGHLLYPGREHCGEIVLADIGIPQSLLPDTSAKTWENKPQVWKAHYPWPQPDSYKYTRGEALILGGEMMTGASRMTALAAARAGAGIVTLAAPTAIWQVYASSITNAIVRPFDNPEQFQRLLDDVRRNAIAIGPGAGVNEDTRQYVLAALATRRAVVLDADALTVFAEDPQTLFYAIKGPCVLTPHTGEFQRLFQVSGDKLLRARKAAKESNAVVVLKGADTVIAAPDGRAMINNNAPPTLATGGSGDVLCGFVAAHLAQGMPALDAAAAAVWLHGACAAEFGPGLIATDLPDALPAVLRKLKMSCAVG